MAIASHLKALQAVELAVRSGSLAVAAEELGITPAAVGQRIKALEDYLGVELLVRGRAGIQPTAALGAAMGHLQNGFAELNEAAAALDLERGQELHVAAPSDIVDLWLKPKLPAFQSSKPQIRFCINGEGDAPMRLSRVDCEIRFEPVPNDSNSEIMFRDLVAPITSPENLKRTSVLPMETRLENFPLLHLDFYKDDPAQLGWPEWIRRNGLTRTAPARGMRFQRIKAAVDAVRADAGFALCGLALIEKQLEEGEIALAFPAALGAWTEWGFVAHFRGDLHKRPALRAFRDWMMGESRATASRLQEYMPTSGLAESEVHLAAKP